MLPILKTADCKEMKVEKFAKHLDFVRELNKLLNLMMTMISIKVGALGTIPNKSGKVTG